MRRRQRKPKDTALMLLMLEAPWLPAPAAAAFLAETIHLGPEWAIAAMSNAHNLVLQRPPDRSLS